MSETDADAEDLISHLCSGLAPDDREDFRRAAESALAASPQCWGPGSIYRTLVPLWREYFKPRPDEHPTWVPVRRRSSKLIEHGQDKGRRRRPAAGLQVVSVNRA